MQHKIQSDLENAHLTASGKAFYVPSLSGRLFGWESTTPTSFTGYATGAIVVDTSNGAVTLGKAAHAGLLLGSGTAATPYTMSGASKSALSFYVTTASTADSNRTAYLRLYVTGAAGGGEALRAFATGSGVEMPALRGAHISASISGSGTVTGEMQAVKGTLHVPNSTLGGTVSGLASEVYADGASSDASNAAIFRGILSGNSTGATALNASAAVLALDGITLGSAGDGKIVDAISGDKAVTHLMKIKLNGTNYYIMLRNAV